MHKIGITGNIGSGKTTVAKVFATLGIPVYDADSRAKALMHESPEIKEGLIALIGPEAYSLDGALNRAFVASIVFPDPAMLAQLNAIVHPAVAKDFDNWVKQQHAPYVLKEAALLYESGSYKSLHKIIVVHCPQELRIERAMQRDGATREAIVSRMEKQMSEEEKIGRADYVLDNSGKVLLLPQVMELHKQLLAL